MSARFALLTGAGPAAIAVVQVSGPTIVSDLARWCQLEPRQLPASGRMRTASLYLDQPDPLDEVLLSCHADHTYRLHLHGSPWLVRQVSDALSARGYAEQAVDDDAMHAGLPQMQTLPGVRWLSSQPDLVRRCVAACSSPADLRRAVRGMLARRKLFDWFARSVRIAVVGPPNAGKSTLINALAQREACLVSDTPGTTRDWVEVHAEISGMPVTWLDTAGLRATEDPLEAAGIDRTRRQIEAADGVLLVVPSGPFERWEAWQELLADEPLAVVRSKADLGSDVGLQEVPSRWRRRLVHVAGERGDGLESLQQVLPAALGRDLSQIFSPAIVSDVLAGELQAALPGDPLELSGVLECWLEG